MHDVHTLAQEESNVLGNTVIILHILLSNNLTLEMQSLGGRKHEHRCQIYVPHSPMIEIWSMMALAPRRGQYGPGEGRTGQPSELWVQMYNFKLLNP